MYERLYKSINALHGEILSAWRLCMMQKNRFRYCDAVRVVELCAALKRTARIIEKEFRLEDNEKLLLESALAFRADAMKVLEDVILAY